MPARIVHGLQEIPPGAHVVTIGNFDGVHRGHRHLFAKVTERARALGARSLAVTFDPLPAEVLRPDRAPKRLTTTQDRLALVAEAGLDCITVVPFTREFAALEAREFVAQLVDAASPREFVVGADFRFGHDRTGSPELLKELGAAYGFGVTVVERIGGERISSTSIRRALTDGDVAIAAELLGRPYALRGRVVPGAGRGRHLGFPTANVTVPDSLVIPADGLYAGRASVEGGPQHHPALIYIGTRPTFAEAERVVEVYLLDFQGDLYGQELTVQFIERLRGDQTFASSEALIEQMRADEVAARRLLGAGGPAQRQDGLTTPRPSGGEAERGND